VVHFALTKFYDFFKKKLKSENGDRLTRCSMTNHTSDVTVGADHKPNCQVKTLS